jgi:hypothetical protein
MSLRPVPGGHQNPFAGRRAKRQEQINCDETFIDQIAMKLSWASGGSGVIWGQQQRNDIPLFCKFP